MIDCVCGKGTGIPEEQIHCPICGLDLSPIHRLRSIPSRMCEQGLALMKENRNQEGLDRFMAALALDPSNASARLLVGNFYLKFGNVDRAISEYQTGLILSPGEEGLARALERAIGLRSEEKKKVVKTMGKMNKIV